MGNHLRQSKRTQLIRKLDANPATAKPEGATWQMFTGQQWTTLITDAAPDAARHDARIQAIRELRSRSAATDAPITLAGPLADGTYVTSVRVDEYLFTNDPTSILIRSQEWCRCPSSQVPRAMHPFPPPVIRAAGPPVLGR